MESATQFLRFISRAAGVLPDVGEVMDQKRISRPLTDSGYARLDVKASLPMTVVRFSPPLSLRIAEEGSKNFIGPAPFDAPGNSSVETLDCAARMRAEWQVQADLLSSLSPRAMKGLNAEQIIARALQSLHRAFPACRALYSTLNAAGERIISYLQETADTPGLVSEVQDLNLAPAYLEALRQQTVVAIPDAANNPLVRPLAARLAQFGCGGLLDAHLLCAERTCRILSLCAPCAWQWTTGEIETLTRAAEHLELLLDHAFVQQEGQQAARSLRRANKRIANILDSVTDAYIALDRDWRITYANHKAEAIVGLPRQELIGINLWRQYPHLAKYRAYTLLREAMSRQTAVRFEEFFERSGRWLELNVCPSQDGLSVYMRDITAHKRAAEELQQGVAALKRSLDSFVQAMSFAIEIRDPFTAGHQRRVSILAARIAARMGLAPAQIEGVRMAGLLHDIGKIAVPAEILCRSGELSRPEHSMIQMHAQSGYNILKDIEFAAPVALVALQHHERLDGSGYPQGLQGDAILLESRIMAVADVVEAMASHRPYRPAVGLQTALEEIMTHRETRYDARAVDACVELSCASDLDFEQMLAEEPGEVEAQRRKRHDAA